MIIPRVKKLLQKTNAMKKAIILLITAANILIGNAQLNEVKVFISREDGYKSFRIPAIISTPEGTLLAFCEGRVNGAGDFGNNDIVMKRSNDKGKTWSKLQVIADLGELQLGNPAPVVDLTDPAYPKGRVFLFYNTGNKNESEIIKGNGIKYCVYKTSDDEGLTWSDPVDITTQVHRPNKPDVDSRFNFSEDWRYYANTPGHALQIQSGKYAGRIFVAANHSAGPPQQAAGHYLAHGYYSDDHGKTFNLGNSLTLPGSNESMAAELSGDRIMMNSRNQKGDIRARIVSISSNGGNSWDTTYFDENLIDPVCQGSIINLGTKKGKNILAFCNAADTKNRNNLTLRISYDDGKTWIKSIPVYSGSFSEKANYAYSAYSDLVAINKSRIGILYEKDNYSSISFLLIKW
jgi:sialidase-1